MKLLQKGIQHPIHPKTAPRIQCCGSAFLIPGSGMRIRDEDPDQPGSYFRELRNNFWNKILKFFDADPGRKNFGSGMEKIRIRDKVLRLLVLGTQT
jgi:hypothetical protein